MKQEVTLETLHFVLKAGWRIYIYVYIYKGCLICLLICVFLLSNFVC